MAKNPKKKVATKKLIGLTSEALRALNMRVRDSKRAQTDVLNDLITGKERFVSGVEEDIQMYQREHGVGRDDAIQSLLIEAKVLRESQK